jgi:uncharacterized membrane protein
MSIWQTSQKRLGLALAVLSVIGLVASFALTYDTIEKIKNPGFNPTCNINPIISCGRAMTSLQGELFGIPNPVYGIMAFTALLAFSVTLLAGARYKRWLWLMAEFVALLGVLFVHYLFFVSMVILGSICPWCSLVWVTTIAIFWYLTTHLVATGMLSWRSTSHQIADFWKTYATLALVLWYLVLIVIIFLRFRDYWMSLL